MSALTGRFCLSADVRHLLAEVERLDLTGVVLVGHRPDELAEALLDG